MRDCHVINTVHDTTSSILGFEYILGKKPHSNSTVSTFKNVFYSSVRHIDSITD